MQEQLIAMPTTMDDERVTTILREMETACERSFNDEQNRKQKFIVEKRVDCIFIEIMTTFRVPLVK